VVQGIGYEYIACLLSICGLPPTVAGRHHSQYVGRSIDGDMHEQQRKEELPISVFFQTPAEERSPTGSTR
jgi:hypothetical protein